MRHEIGNKLNSKSTIVHARSLKYYYNYRAIWYNVMDNEHARIE